MKRWKEYIDEKGKVLETPKTEENPDYHGKTPDAPEKNIKRKDVESKTETGEKGNSYIAKSEKNSEKPLGDHGDTKLVYEPKTKSEGFISQTKDMTNEEFAKFMLGQGAGINSTIHRFVECVKENPESVGNLVHELYREGLFGELVTNVITYKEAFDIIESVSPPVRPLDHMDTDEEEDEEESFGDEEPIEDEEALDDEESMPDEEDEEDREFGHKEKFKMSL